jgi:hypothetical protein
MRKTFAAVPSWAGPIGNALLISANTPPTVASDRANRSRRRMTSVLARRRAKQRRRTMVKAQVNCDAGVKGGGTAPPTLRETPRQVSSARAAGVPTSREV